MRERRERESEKEGSRIQKDSKSVSTVVVHAVIKWKIKCWLKCNLQVAFFKTQHDTKKTKTD